MSNPVTILLLLRRVDCNDGVASYCESLVKGLAARGDKVVIVSGRVTHLYGSETRFKAISENVLDWVVMPEIMSKLPKPAASRNILRVMRKYSVDVIGTQGLSTLPLAALLSKLSGRPVVANYHPSGGGGAPGAVATARSLKTRLGYRTIATLFPARRFIAISREAQEFFQQDCGVRASRITLIRNGVDLAVYRPPSPAERQAAKARFALPERALVCVLSGRLNFVKGHDVAVDAVRLLRRTRPELEIICLFAGAGDQADQIRDYALKDAADAKAFRFLGFMHADALRDAYWAAEISVLPSRFEGAPISVIETMACGCVPIRTPSGGSRDQIIDGSNGFLVPFNDPQALADRILDLSDPARRATMRQNAIDHVISRFSEDQMIAQTSDLYRQAGRN